MKSMNDLRPKKYHALNQASRLRLWFATLESSLRLERKKKGKPKSGLPFVTSSRSDFQLSCPDSATRPALVEAACARLYVSRLK
jgi:hypothetical protein